MVLGINDCLDIFDSIFQCIKLKEQQEAAQLIDLKLAQLNNAIFNKDKDTQKYFVIHISKLKLVRDRIQFKVNSMENSYLKDIWNTLIDKINEKLIEIKRRKKLHSKLGKVVLDK